MAWIEITEDHVKTTISSPELDAARTKLLAAGQADPLLDAIAQVTREVRGYVAGWPQNTLGEGQTIPDECLSAALDLLGPRLVKRLPVRGFMTPAREEAMKQAIDFLKLVCAGKIRIVQPLTVTTEPIAGPATQLISSRRRQATREDLRGL